MADGMGTNAVEGSIAGAEATPFPFPWPTPPRGFHASTSPSGRYGRWSTTTGERRLWAIPRGPLERIASSAPFTAGRPRGP